MAARANPFFDIAATAEDIAAQPRSAVAHLAQMHAEAVETARLANLVGRALHAAIALPVLAALAVMLGGGAGLASTVAWGILVGVATLAILRAYGHAIRQPFERAPLHAFAQDISACLLYAGFAWGAGAFLALSTASSGAALLFAAVPAIAIAVLLREKQAALLFLAPVAALTAFACVLRPFAGGALAASLVLIACAIVASATVAASRYAAKRHAAELPHGLFAT
ncbi:MAG TPA: hypothetical protein VHZ78_00185 [Rhizomicrobium sp.]|jgi:hypothetical protein|nr:hypothetical protein [Rhizomicrobium sp.]